MRFVVFAALGAGLLACGDSTLDPLPLDVRVEASRTSAAPADSISFLVTAQGGSMVGIETDYGDGSSDLFDTGGARTARVTFRHAYSTRGMFEVTATVTDAVLGQKAVSLEININ